VVGWACCVEYVCCRGLYVDHLCSSAYADEQYTDVVAATAVDAFDAFDAFAPADHRSFSF
jgi:hypothetical protein